jgi:hypothetical protein
MVIAGQFLSQCPPKLLARSHSFGSRDGARQGRTSLPGHQAPVKSHENAVSWTGQEPGASVHPVRARQPVPRPSTAAGMRMSQSEVGIDAAQTV